jgi:hypothetical protein
VVLNHASWSDEFVIRGLTVGEGPARALESRFEKGFFRVSEFLMARQAACRRFEVKGRCPVAGIEADLSLPAEDPFQQDDAPCRSDRDDAARVFVVKAPAPKATSGQGQLTLRLRDVDHWASSACCTCSPARVRGGRRGVIPPSTSRS